MSNHTIVTMLIKLMCVELWMFKVQRTRTDLQTLTSCNQGKWTLSFVETLVEPPGGATGPAPNSLLEPVSGPRKWVRV